MFCRLFADIVIICFYCWLAKKYLSIYLLCTYLSVLIACCNTNLMYLIYSFYSPFIVSNGQRFITPLSLCPRILLSKHVAVTILLILFIYCRFSLTVLFQGRIEERKIIISSVQFIRYFALISFIFVIVWLCDVCVQGVKVGYAIELINCASYLGDALF